MTQEQLLEKLNEILNKKADEAKRTIDDNLNRALRHYLEGRVLDLAIRNMFPDAGPLMREHINTLLADVFETGYRCGIHIGGSVTVEHAVEPLINFIAAQAAD